MGRTSGGSYPASIGGAGVGTEGGAVVTLTAAGAARNTLDDGGGNATFSHTLAVTSHLSCAGSVQASAARTATTTTTISSSDFDVDLDATGGAFVATLNLLAGQVVTLTKIDATANAITLTPASGTINGAASKALGTQWESVTVYNNGTNYRIVGANAGVLV